MVTNHRRICESFHCRPPTPVLGEGPPHRYRWQRRPGNDSDDDDPVVPATRLRHTLYFNGEKVRKARQRLFSRRASPIQHRPRRDGTTIGQRRPICSVTDDGSNRSASCMAIGQERQGIRKAHCYQWASIP